MKKKVPDLLVAVLISLEIVTVILLFVSLFTSNSSSNSNHESVDITDETDESSQTDENTPRIISNTKPGTFESGGTYSIFAEGYGLVGTADAYMNCSIAVSKPLEVYSAGYPITITLALNDVYKEFSLNAGDAKMLECVGSSGYSVYLYVIVT